MACEPDCAQNSMEQGIETLGETVDVYIAGMLYHSTSVNHADLRHVIKFGVAATLLPFHPTK